MFSVLLLVTLVLELLLPGLQAALQDSIFSETDIATLLGYDLARKANLVPNQLANTKIRGDRVHVTLVERELQHMEEAAPLDLLQAAARLGESARNNIQVDMTDIRLPAVKATKLLYPITVPSWFHVNSNVNQRHAPSSRMVAYFGGIHKREPDNSGSSTLPRLSSAASHAHSAAVGLSKVLTQSQGKDIVAVLKDLIPSFNIDDIKVWQQVLIGL